MYSISFFVILVQISLCTTTTQKLWPLLTGGRCSVVAYHIKIEIGPFKWWPLYSGGRYSEVAISSGLTVLLM